MKLVKEVNQFLGKLGFVISRPPAPVANLSANSDNLIEAVYRAKGKPFLFNVPLSICREFSFCLDDQNPFVKTLIGYGRQQYDSYTGSPLQQFFDEWQPRTLAEEKGLSGSAINAFLLNAPEYCHINPWGEGYNTQYYKSRMARKGFMQICKENNISPDDVSGLIYFGPVSSSFGEITFKRLTKIYTSIKRNGYNPHAYKAYILANIYMRDNDFRVTLISGRHRLAALAALGYEKVPILFNQSHHPLIIRKEDAAHWPNVKAGYFTQEQACSIFDRFFDGRHPWLDKQ